jgi:hypothetical protein
MCFPAFSVRILAIIAPSLLYMTSIQMLENYLDEDYGKAVEEIYIGDIPSLLHGTVRLQDAIRKRFVVWKF